MNIERWLPVVGYEGLYEVSDCGNVRRIGLSITGKRPKRGNRRLSMLQGYIRISLCDANGKGKARYVHVLVAAAFIGPCPKGKQINHKDGKRDNNVPENLEYVTALENIRHARRVLHSHGPEGIQCRTARLTPEAIHEIRKLRSQGMIYREIAIRYGVSLQNIHYITSGKYWKQVPQKDLDL